MMLLGMDQRGIGLPIVLMVSLAVGIMTIALGRWIKTGSGMHSYTANMEKAFQLAEKGRDAAMGAFSHDTSSTTHGPKFDADLSGQYTTKIFPTAFPPPANYYLVTSATRTVGGRSYSCRLHTYAQVTDIGGYFAAVTDVLSLSHPVDISQGAIYGLDLKFEFDDIPQTLTKVRRAEFLNTCTPALNWTAAFKTNEVVITEGANNEPVQLTRPLILPQLLEEDEDRYKSLAGVHTTRRQFSGDIYPPGYASGGCAAMSGDTYANRTCNNFEHVYFSSYPVTISSAVVHGQVVVFSTENIFLSSDVVSAAGTAPLPGAGSPLASTAHQLILISVKDVAVATASYTAAFISTQKIQAFIVTPKGTFRPTAYPNPAVHSKLKLDFTGGLILKTLNANDSFPAVFNAGRTYRYMDSLRTSPPPYLPPAAQIVYSFQQAGAFSGN